MHIWKEFWIFMNESYFTWSTEEYRAYAQHLLYRKLLSYISIGNDRFYNNTISTISNWNKPFQMIQRFIQFCDCSFYFMWFAIVRCLHIAHFYGNDDGAFLNHTIEFITLNLSYSISLVASHCIMFPISIAALNESALLRLTAVR